MPGSIGFTEVRPKGELTDNQRKSKRNLLGLPLGLEERERRGQAESCSDSAGKGEKEITGKWVGGRSVPSGEGCWGWISASSHLSAGEGAAPALPAHCSH